MAGRRMYMGDQVRPQSAGRSCLGRQHLVLTTRRTEELTICICAVCFLSGMCAAERLP